MSIKKICFFLLQFLKNYEIWKDSNPSLLNNTFANFGKLPLSDLCILFIPLTRHLEINWN